MIDRIEIIDKAYNPGRNPIYYIIGMITLALGLILDYFIFPNDTIPPAYIPFLIIMGLLSRSITLSLIFTGIGSTAILLTSPDQWLPELFFLRWMGYFLIVYIVQTLLEKNLKERENLLNFTVTLAETIDARDSYTAYHSKNVAYYSYEIGKQMNLTEKECLNLYIGGLLHDIGKIGIPEGILNKPSRLTNEEFQILKEHPQIGYDMLKHIPSFKNGSILDMVLHHHERFDGTGYPYGLKGESIPIVARIMGVADAFDAMTSKRIYRDTNDLEWALNEISKGKQKQFDAEIADVFLDLIYNEKIIVRGFKPD